jgi:NodT family efflux transporter outer membrane factor (OMF) lipoprotein
MRALVRGVCHVAALAVLFVQGCKVGPDYVQPEIEMPDAWQTAVAEEMSQEESPLVTWWDELGDTLLTDMIRRAELANLDLKVAVARVREARALRGIAKGGLYPDLILNGAYSYFKISENSPTGQAIKDAGGNIQEQELWDFSLDAFWEIDLFGRIRRQVEAATAGFEASIEDYRDVLVSLYAEVAAAYIDVRTFQARVNFARRNAATQRETVGLTRDRFNAGLVSGLDVSQAESQFASTAADIPSLEILLNNALNRLAVLLGEHPGALNSELGRPSAIPTPPAEITAGLPAELLRRRPDVRRAERLLASQTALIGVATADLYPSFSLGGFIELVAGNFADLGEGESVGWGLIPGLRWNLFAGGKIRNNIRVQEARTEQLLYLYEQSVLLALEEVEDALVAYEREKVRRGRLQEATDAAQRSLEIVRIQYLSGLTDFQRFLDSQRALFVEQDRLAASEGQVVRNLVALNKALGGGWQVEKEPPDRQNAEPDGAEEAEAASESEASSQDS